MNRGMLIIVSGPSGSGKGTILERVFADDKRLAYSVSCTTRAPREGERDGVHYRFISREAFERNIAENKMLEYAVYCDNYYGTSAAYVEETRSKGYDVVLEIETEGARKVLQKCPDAVTIFITPPSMDVLHRRLAGRGTETDDVIRKRIEKAKAELRAAQNYRYIVVNNVLEDAVDDMKAILRAERIKNNKMNLEV